MPRCGPILLGAGFDPNDPNYSLFFKANTLNAPILFTYWSIGFGEAFALVYKIALLDFSYNINTPSGGNISNSGTGAMVNNETQLICNSNYIYLFDIGDPNWASAGILLDGYDNGTKLFALEYSFLGAGASGISSDSSSFASPIATTVSANILGHIFTFYQESTDPFVASGNYTVGINSYWAQDDGTVNNPATNPFGGPVWDTTTGALVLSQVPTGLVGA